MEEFECSDCGATVKSNNKYCPSCGVKFEDDGVVSENASYEMNYEDILTLLIGTVEENVHPSELVQACKKFNMRQINYFNINEDPLFDFGYNFIFQPKSGEEAKLEIIEIEGYLLQSGFQILYKPKLSIEQINKDFSLLYSSLKSYYTKEQPQSLGELEIINFYNEVSQCYISKSKVNGQDVLNFRISNKEVWMRYN